MTFIRDAKLGGVMVMALGRRHSIRGLYSRSGGRGSRNSRGGYGQGQMRKFLWGQSANIESFARYISGQGWDKVSRLPTDLPFQDVSHYRSDQERHTSKSRKTSELWWVFWQPWPHPAGWNPFLPPQCDHLRGGSVLPFRAYWPTWKLVRTMHICILPLPMNL